MTARAVPLSVRVSHEDAEFIAQLNIEDAKTPSDKLRAIISRERHKQQATQSRAQARAESQDLLEPLQHAIRQYEVNNDTYSEAVHVILNALPDLLADVFSSPARHEPTEEHMVELEKHLVSHLFRLFESLLKLDLIDEVECYDKQVLTHRVERIAELVKLLPTQQQ